MTCHCYPADRGYPESLRMGCTSYDHCHVMAEMREGRTAEGRAAQAARYRGELTAGAERTEKPPEARDVISRLQRLDVPATEMFAALKNDKPTRAINEAQSWWVDADKRYFPALVMAGDVGQGKTVAAAWVAVAWAKAYPWNSMPTGSAAAPFVWLAGPAMRKLGEWGEAAQELLANTAAAQLAIIDDAGREGDRRASEALSDVLMERVDRGRLTVLSSNVTGETFRARYGIALADRLRTKAVIVSVKGASMRTRT